LTNADNTPFTHTLRVRWSEVDLQKVVFNGNYLNYFDVAFTEYMRGTGLPTALAQHAAGFEMFAKKATVEYHAPAHFDDELNITVRPVKLGNTSVVFALEVWRGAPAAAGSSHIVTGELVYVHVETAVMKPAPWPQLWRQAFATPSALSPDS
jgi:acyl-CoA thioester hydrolase